MTAADLGGESRTHGPSLQEAILQVSGHRTSPNVYLGTNKILLRRNGMYEDLTIYKGLGGARESRINNTLCPLHSAAIYAASVTGALPRVASDHHLLYLGVRSININISNMQRLYYSVINELLSATSASCYPESRSGDSDSNISILSLY